MEGVYTTLESEQQFVWTYYYQRHRLGGAGSESNKFCAMANEDYFSNTLLLQMFLLLLTTVTATRHW